MHLKLNYTPKALIYQGTGLKPLIKDKLNGQSLSKSNPHFEEEMLKGSEVDPETSYFGIDSTTSTQ